MQISDITAARAHVVNLETGEVCYTKDTGSERRAASLVKLLTVYVVRQHKLTLESLSATTTITSDDVSVGGSGANLLEGDVISLHELVHDALLPSSNQASLALARFVGQELLDVEPAGGATPVARFVSEMRTQACKLGLAGTVVVDPHGFDPRNVTSPADVCILLASLRDDEVVLDAWRYGEYRMSLVRGGMPAIVTIAATNRMNADIGVFGGKTGTVAGETFNLALLWEAPNGQTLACCVLASSTSSSRYADMRAILARLLVDFPSLAKPGNLFTPAYLFDSLGYGGGWWDGSDTETLFVDAEGMTAVTAEGQPVGRWQPKAGNASYWRQAVLKNRPKWHQRGFLKFDGRTDYLDFGSTRCARTNLFASSTDTFIVGLRFSTAAAKAVLIAKAGTRASTRTFQVHFDSAFHARPAYYLRGATLGKSYAMNDGILRSLHIWWDGTAAAVDVRAKGSVAVSVGSACDETEQNITMGARTGGTRAHLSGQIHQLVIVDSYDRDAMRRLRDWFAGGAINAFSQRASLPPLTTSVQL